MLQRYNFCMLTYLRQKLNFDLNFKKSRVLYWTIRNQNEMYPTIHGVHPFPPTKFHENTISSVGYGTQIRYPNYALIICTLCRAQNSKSRLIRLHRTST